jgi:hypothetical protein
VLWALARRGDYEPAKTDRVTGRRLRLPLPSEERMGVRGQKASPLQSREKGRLSAG